ncbi:peptidylprolyl isomerase PrsA [Lactobacillus selangorensis]|uniref:peptidylprolyl isomerase PrsA n=1 Tax=Lactobacillus selangorensis TaxID=81857 RepID=UPI00070AE61D|nr:peptidylprolyl isomerase PrsA [Lactobacillus selangorensis]
MKKKWLAAAAGLVLALSMTLAGCSAGGKTVATLKGGKITQEQYYDEMKKSSAGKQTLQTMILTKALENQYGSKVSSKKVDKEYNKYKSQYGSSFSAVLEQNSLTKSSFKKSIRLNMLEEAALKANKKVTNADLKKQWKSYEPKVQVQHILVSKKSTAETIIKDLQANNTEAEFKKLAKKYSTDTGTKNDAGKLSAFDSTDTSLDSTFKKAAFKLKTGEITTTPVKTQYGYHVIRMIKNPGKGTMASHKAELTQQVYDGWMQDSTVMNSVVSKVLKKANVSIKDSDLKNILSDYVGSSSSSK